jgi:hypothetical protein
VFESRHPDHTEAPTIKRTIRAPLMVGVLLELWRPAPVNLDVKSALSEHRKYRLDDA